LTIRPGQLNRGGRPRRAPPFIFIAVLLAMVLVPGPVDAQAGDASCLLVASTASATQVFQSEDGKSWSEVSVTHSSRIFSLAYGGGQWVMMGFSHVMTSPDGQTWTTHSSPGYTDVQFLDVAHNGDRWVAVGTDGIYTSVSGSSWTKTQATTQIQGGVSFGNGTWVSVQASTAQPQTRHSANGLTWTDADSSSQRNWRSVAHGAHGHIAVGGTSGSGAQAMRTVDGATWVDSGIASGDWRAVSYGNGRYVALHATTTATQTTTDGATWSAGGTVTAEHLTHYDAGLLFVAASGSGSNRIKWSDDGGSTWTNAGVTPSHSTSGLACMSSAPIGSPLVSSEDSIVGLMVDTFGDLFGVDSGVAATLLGVFILIVSMYFGAKAGAMPLAAITVSVSGATWYMGLLPPWIAIVAVLLGLASVAKRLG
jgi:hypothetical protein